MNRLVILLMFTGLLTMAACDKKGQNQKLEEPNSSMINEENPAEMTFKDTLFDFGTIAEGEVVEREYEFTNTGKSPLRIVDAKAGCSCTVPEWPKEPIPPGQGGVIKVRFDSKMKHGMDISKTIRISANTYPETKNKVYLTGKVAG